MMKIRDARAEDAPLLDEMLTQLIRYEKRWNCNLDDTFSVKDNYIHRIGQPGNKLLVAEEDGELLGFVFGFSYHSPVEIKPVVILDALYVVPNARKKGCATALIRELRKFAVDEGAVSLELKVFSENKPAELLYSGMGFVETKKYMSLRVEGEMMQ